MSINDSYIPFSQRTGLTEAPPQLKLGEVSGELRRLIDYALSKEIERVERYGVNGHYFDGKWKEVAADFHVIFLQKPASTFENKSYTVRKSLENGVAKARYGDLFDLVEFFVRHPGCGETLKAELAEAFKLSRAAYRIIDGQVVAIGTEDQAEAFARAVAAADWVGAAAAKRHLVASGVGLRDGNWADSVRESIHAVEAMARKIDPAAKTLGEALKALDKKVRIHGSLKDAFNKLYGFTNDERGIRHALADDTANVDETDALFMLGACASFVSYLISRDTSSS